MRSCLPASTIADLSALFEVCFILQIAIFACNSSVIVISVIVLLSFSPDYHLQFLWNGISDLFEQFCRNVFYHWGRMLLILHLCYSLNWQKAVFFFWCWHITTLIAIMEHPLFLITEKFNVISFHDVSFIPKHTLFLFQNILILFEIQLTFF